MSPEAYPRVLFKALKTFLKMSSVLIQDQTGKWGDSHLPVWSQGKLNKPTIIFLMGFKQEPSWLPK